jgi:hypothetical protein
MLASLKFKGALVGLTCIMAFASMTDSALALSAEVAKKCNALTAEMYPPLVVGNPAAGRKGTPKERQDFYRKCIQNGGKMPEK